MISTFVLPPRTMKNWPPTCWDSFRMLVPLLPRQIKVWLLPPPPTITRQPTGSWRSAASPVVVTTLPIRYILQQQAQQLAPAAQPCIPSQTTWITTCTIQPTTTTLPCGRPCKGRFLGTPRSIHNRIHATHTFVFHITHPGPKPFEVYIFPPYR